MIGGNLQREHKRPFASGSNDIEQLNPKDVCTVNPMQCTVFVNINCAILCFYRDSYRDSP